jgi:hypothetical protein
MNNQVLNNMDNDPFDNIWKYFIFGIVYICVFVVITSIIADYDSVVNACDVSNYKNNDYAYVIAQCNKSKIDYIVRDINRFYTLFFVGLFSILIGAYISKSHLSENYKIAGRSLVTGGLGLIVYFIMCDENILSYFSKNCIFAFTIGITWGFIFTTLLDFDLI